MSLSVPPLEQQILDESGATVPEWLLWFDGTYKGDAGTLWTPTFSGLTEVGGAADITGRFFKLSKYLTYFTVTITPQTNTSSTSGTTYINNFPLNINGDGIIFAVTNGFGTGSGHIVASSNRAYVPAWTTITNPITLIGICEAT